jgi:hypothetical protein
MLRIFPMLLVSVVIYNVIAFGYGFAGHGSMQVFLGTPIATFNMFSGDHWPFSLADLLLLLSLILLFVEIAKATRSTGRELINHGLSMLTFVIALVEFITVRGFSTSAFFFITAMTLFDVVGGYTISAVAAEHALSIGRT